MTVFDPVHLRRVGLLGPRLERLCDGGQPVAGGEKVLPFRLGRHPLGDNLQAAGQGLQSFPQYVRAVTSGSRMRRASLASGASR